jgi:uncharacterized protein (DUF58 family)
MFEPFTANFFKQLQQLKIRSRRAYLGSRQGSHRSIRRGHGLEFSDYRPYSSGDDFRHIDWNVYGKTDRIYVREFREEQELNVLLLIDGSNSMAFPNTSGVSPENDNSKFNFARKLALALAYVALSDGDTVSIAILGRKLLPRYSNARSIGRLYQQLLSVAPAGQFQLEDEVRAALASLRLPGKCYFISDCLYDPPELFGALDLVKGRNFDLALIQTLAPEELTIDDSSAVSWFVDSETSEELSLDIGKGSKVDYAKILASHVESIERYCAKGAIAHAVVSSAENVADVVLSKLPQLRLIN